MPEYVPLFKPGQSITRTASAGVTGGQLLMVSGSGTVAATSGAVTSWVGVAAFDAAAGELVTVHKGGVQRIVAAGAVTAGDQVVAASNGRVASLAAAAGATASDINSARQVVGVALTTAADGALVEVDVPR